MFTSKVYHSFVNEIRRNGDLLPAFVHTFPEVIGMDSIWREAKKTNFTPLQGSLKTDVLIIGGGMAGLLCAHKLHQTGINYALVEAKQICSGVTENTTAKITAQHGLVYDRLLHTLGQERARMYLNANLAAVAEYRALAQTIDCDFEEKDSYVYELKDAQKLEKELGALRTLGYEAELTHSLPLPFPTAGAVKFSGQAQFHPLKFAAAIADGKNIFEQTKVLELGKHFARTDHGTIRARKIIVCTHFPLLNKHGGFSLKLYQQRSYVLALKNAANVDGMYVDGESGGLSFRNQGDLLLLGGAGARTGKKCGGWDELEQKAKLFYPEAKAVSRWATQDCMSLDGSAYIGRYSKGSEDLFVASGFNKWGMTTSMVAANILSELVQGRENAFAPAFDPSRSMVHPQLAANAWESTLNLLTPTAPRCPHLGCALKYNKAEHSWDCPCHGSRFSEDGKLLNNPATDDKKMSI